LDSSALKKEARITLEILLFINRYIIVYCEIWILRKYRCKKNWKFTGYESYSKSF